MVLGHQNTPSQPHLGAGLARQTRSSKWETQAMGTHEKILNLRDLKLLRLVLCGLPIHRILIR